MAPGRSGIAGRVRRFTAVSIFRFLLPLPMHSYIIGIVTDLGQSNYVGLHICLQRSSKSISARFPTPPSREAPPVTDAESATPERETETVRIDTDTAHPARVYDYWLGGTTNFEADRKAGDAVLASRPGLQWSVRANRAFLVRVVTYLAAQAGIKQFLDIGTGIPFGDNVHEIAQRQDPQSRVVYVDNDPIVLAHAHELLKSDPQGATAYIEGDLRDTAGLLARAARTLDFDRPVAILLLGVLHLISDDEDPHSIVGQLLDTVPSGSYLVISHPASDLLPDTQSEASRRYNTHVATHQTLRNRAEVASFFNGLEMIEPGLTQWHQWRHDPTDSDPDDAKSGHCGVAKKP
jgi:hypothetical protein